MPAVGEGCWWLAIKMDPEVERSREGYIDAQCSSEEELAMRRGEVMRLLRNTRQQLSWGESGDAVMRTVVASSRGSRGRTSRVSTRQSRRTTRRCGGTGQSDMAVVSNANARERKERYNGNGEGAALGWVGTPYAHCGQVSVRKLRTGGGQEERTGKTSIGLPWVRVSGPFRQVECIQRRHSTKAWVQMRVDPCYLV